MEDPTRHGEGQTYLHTEVVVTDLDGVAQFDVTLPFDVAGGKCISMTATDSSGNTSEFSPCERVPGPHDTDFDGVPDPIDVCPCTEDPDQADADADGQGDACEDGASTSKVFTVTNKLGGDFPGSLIRAILDARDNPGRDSIRFNITEGAPPYIIDPFGSMPPNSEPVEIQGNTQPGYEGKPIVYIDGTNNLSSEAPIILNGGDSTLFGIGIFGYTGEKVSILTKGGNEINNCDIGIDPSLNGFTTENGEPGLQGFGMQDGIAVDNSANNRIVNNRIGFNLQNGIRIDGAASTGTVVMGNLIGPGVHRTSGTFALGNVLSGVAIENGASHNRIGGPGPGEGNIIAANEGGGVSIRGLSSRFNVVQGNWIGVDVAGGAGDGSFGNGQNGVGLIQTRDNTIGGAGIGEGNIITASAINGVLLDNAAINNTVQGNTIGPDAAEFTAAQIVDFLVGILDTTPEGADRNDDGRIDIGDAVTAVNED
jgi:hypothetical protein